VARRGFTGPDAPMWELTATVQRLTAEGSPAPYPRPGFS
jgi:hypothetical protein